MIKIVSSHVSDFDTSGKIVCISEKFCDHTQRRKSFSVEQPVKESSEMSTLGDVNTYTSKAEDDVECQNYENAGENISLASKHLEKVSSIDSVLIKSISKKQDHILDLLKVVKSSSKSHQQPSLFPAQFGKEAEAATLENVYHANAQKSQQHYDTKSFSSFVLAIKFYFLFTIRCISQ